MSVRNQAAAQLRHLQGLYLRYQHHPERIAQFEQLFGLRRVAADEVSELAAESALQLSEFLYGLGDSHAMSWIASELDMAAGDGLVYYLRAANSLEVAIDEIVRLAPMLFPDGEIQFVRKPHDWQLRLIPRVSTDRMGMLLRYEAILIWLMRVVSYVLGVAAPPVSIQVMTPKTASNEFDTLCAVSVRYAAECFGLTWPNHYLASKLPGSSTNLYLAIQPMLNQRLQVYLVQDTLTQKVGRYLTPTANLAHADLAQTAAALGMSSAMLRRQLSLENTSFSQILLQIKRRTAIQALLNTSARLDDVALQIGFAERSAFERAFGQWFGLSPSQFRRELVACFPNALRESSFAAERWPSAELHSAALDALLLQSQQESLLLAQFMPYCLDNPKLSALLLLELNLPDIACIEGIAQQALHQQSLALHTYKNLLLSSRGIQQRASQRSDWLAVLSANFARAVLAEYSLSPSPSNTMLWAVFLHRLAAPASELAFAVHCRRSALLLMVWGVNADVVRCLNQWANQSSPESNYLSAALAWLAAMLAGDSVAEWRLPVDRLQVEAEWAGIWRRLCERWHTQNAAPLDFLALMAMPD
ncbi:helix-turn-helix transcriptional regulator [Deefgea rivuli]|uniref:helix-turn-helix transcriptional regulator n=1 Tax=Deefgea rivuli TaxID=400948 RepID=UPI000481300C|nr:AraC family transcriptional regulator [Deefgea rivuli]